MTKTEYRKYIDSDHWRDLRKQLLEESDMLCERCRIPRWLAQTAYDQDFHVHHKHYRTLGSETADDLEILCRRCHEVETFGKSELRKVPTYTCNWCGDSHYDPYQECTVCLALSSAGDRLFIHRLMEPCGEQYLWESILRDLHFVARYEPLAPSLFKYWSYLCKTQGKTMQ
jgi:hypothetical protein